MGATARQLDAIQAELDQKADSIKRQAQHLYAAPVEVRPCVPVGDTRTQPLLSADLTQCCPTSLVYHISPAPATPFPKTTQPN